MFRPFLLARWLAFDVCGFGREQNLARKVLRQLQDLLSCPPVYSQFVRILLRIGYHEYLFPLFERALRSQVILRKDGQVELCWSRLTDLAQLHSFRFTDERQALIRVFLVRPSRPLGNEWTDKPLFAVCPEG